MYTPHPAIRQTENHKINMRQIQHIRHQGFTLIEILVVVVLISIMMGVMLMNFSPGGDEELAQEESLRLQNLLRFAHEQSVIRGEEIGLRVFENAYRFMRLDEETEEWFAIIDDKLLRDRPLPEPLQLDLYLEQLPVDLPSDIQDEPPTQPEFKPQIDITEDKDEIDLVGDIDLVKDDELNMDKKDNIEPQIFLMSSGELSPAFEIRLRVPGSDIETYMHGLPQGEFKPGSPDE